jgi:hypothetical protein
MGASNNLSVTGSDLVAGDTNLVAKNGDLNIVDTTVLFDNAWLKSGNNISILNSPQFDVRGYLGLTAANQITAINVVGRIGGVAGDLGLAEFDAMGFHLFDWHFFTKTMLLDGIDIYNDPAYWNSLAYDRIVRSLDSKKRKDSTEDEDDYDITIGGQWLTEGDDFMNVLEETEPAIVPISENSQHPKGKNYIAANLLIFD